MMERLPAPGHFGVVLCPRARGCRRAEVYAEARSAGARTRRRGARRIAGAAARGGRWRAHRRSTTPSSSSTTWPEARFRCGPRSTPRSRRSPSAGAAVTLVTGSGPTAVGLFEDIVAADRAAAELPPRFANAIVAAPDAGRMSTSDGHRRGSRLAAGGDRRRGGRRVRGAEPASCPTSTSRRRSRTSRRASATSPMCWSALAAFLETGAFVGLVLPGETVVHPRRRGRGTGRDVDRAHDRGHLGGGVPGGHDELPARARGWGGDSSCGTARGCASRRERFARVEDYFSRHGGKTIVVGRFIGLVRALAPFVAGSSGMRYSYYLPFSVLGTGLWAAAFCADRVLRVSEPRRGGQGGGRGHAAVRDRGGRDRGDRAGRSVPARCRRTGGGWWRGWSAVARFVRCSPLPAGWSRRRAS